MLPLRSPSYPLLRSRPSQGTSEAHQDSRVPADVDSSPELLSSHRVKPQIWHGDQIWFWALQDLGSRPVQKGTYSDEILGHEGEPGAAAFPSVGGAVSGPPWTSILHVAGGRRGPRGPAEDALLGPGSSAAGGGGERRAAGAAGRAGGGRAGRSHRETGESSEAEFPGRTDSQAGEEGAAGSECQGGPAVEGGQRSAEGAAGSGDGAGSRAAPDGPDPPESEEAERAEVTGSDSAGRGLHEGFHG